jgi:sugar/nucleoside kinase (ribokinase family)
MLKNDVAVVGEIYIDHVFTGFARWPQPGEEVFTRDYTREIGGGAAITACALARLGRTAGLYGVVGAADAEWFDNRLRSMPVASDSLTKVEGNTGVTVSVSLSEDRAFFSCAGENEQLPAMLRSPAMLASLRRARHVHFALPLDRGLALDLLPALRAGGCTTSLDVGFHPEWLSAPENLDICRATDYLLVNEKEAGILGGGDAMSYLSFAQQKGLRHPIVKRGAQGAAMIADGMLYQVGPPPVAAVDTTGAGDAFDAGFIDALLDAASPEECLRRACICGALSTRATGALSALPGRDELKTVYEQIYAP